MIAEPFTIKHGLSSAIISSQDLFGPPEPGTEDKLAPQAIILRGFALPYQEALLQAIATICEQAPLRHMQTPGGFTMSAALSNCGQLGWTSSQSGGYRYQKTDPANGRPWPDMPEVLEKLASSAARRGGFMNFEPDACLINRYLPGAKMSLHQDKNESDFSAPIVSVSLGMTAIFLFGGHSRTDKPLRTHLYHGDVAIWGGQDRLRYHGILPLRHDPHPLLGSQRINLTLRKAG